MSDTAVRELAGRAGIAVEWRDYANEQHRVSAENLRRILAALQLPCDTAADLAQSRRQLETSRLPPLITATTGQPFEVPAAGKVPDRVRVTYEDGTIAELPVRSALRGVRLPGIETPGYHVIELGAERITVAIAPPRCYTIADITPEERPWGLAVQAYGLRGAGDCGIGDTAGVIALAGKAAGLRADAVVLSPVHALFAADPNHFSPYSPSSRLVAVRVEDDEVFEAVHATLFRHYAEGLIDGVRVDHIDGLARPQDYSTNLRTRLHALERERPKHCPAGPAYFIVEKILADGEKLPQGWGTDGTTGYDFMDEVSALQHDEAGERPLTDLWERVSGRFGDFGREEEPARRQILQQSFSAQVGGVVRAFYQIAQGDLAMRDIARPAIHRVLTEILVHFPVYRIYAGVAHASPPDLSFLAQAVARAKITCLPSDRWLVEILGRWLGGARIRSGADAPQAIALARFQQLSAALCAKAVEDTAFYRYGRLVSRNDVGFDPRRLSCASAEFHRRIQARAADFPHSMLATATHDHKRGEDVRARLAVLSESAGKWTRAVERWIGLCVAHCAAAGTTPMPSAGDIAILLQTIVGAWPPGLEPTNRGRLVAHAKRIAAWQQKALREAKLFSDWSAPNESYERAARELVAWLLAGPSELLAEIADFARRITPAGVVNGLAQALLKLTAPGVPDIHQGTEYWDFSLVDPDNRSPVDFAMRRRSLGKNSAAALVAALAADWADGRIKQAMIARVLAVRKKMPHLFADGSYVPLEAAGPFAGHVFAFARILGNSAAVVAICRCCTSLLSDDGSLTIPPARWKDTRILLPRELQGIKLGSVLTGEEIATRDHPFAAAQILSSLPVALLTDQSR